MKNSKTILSLAVASALIISAPMLSFADNGKGNHDKVKESVKQEQVKEEKTKPNEEGKSKEKDIAWKEAKQKLETDKDAVELQKDELEAQKEELEKQYEEAEESGNVELAEQLKAQLQEIETKRLALKAEMKGLLLQMKEVTKNRYSLEELEELQNIGKELAESDEEITVIPVENIIVKNKDIKFDTPPVIKQRRTLIPVRAITQGFGAELDWSQEEQKVTITKGDVEIILHIDSNVALVNGQEVQIEVPSALYSNRTYVPLRFIIENLGLEIDYDNETDIIEIDEETDEDIDEEEAEDTEEELTEDDDANDEIVTEE